MNNFIRILTVLGLVGASTLVVEADNTASSGGNQLGNQLTSQNQTHWYEKAAETVGPVADISAKGGTLLELQKGSFLYLIGDSTLHQYQMRSGSLEGSAVVKGALASEGILKALQAGKVGDMTLVVPVENFKSRESGLDDNAYKALKSKDNPEIKFTLEKETLKAGDKDGSYVMTATGNLSIAGTTAPVTLTADTTVKDGQVELKGVQKLKMSDYQVKPPSISLLVTSITCKDEIEIHYDVTFAPVGEANSEAKK
jgi:polyisoprenoid-binding protein YceI